MSSFEVPYGAQQLYYDEQLADSPVKHRVLTAVHEYILENTRAEHTVVSQYRDAAGSMRTTHSNVLVFRNGESTRIFHVLQILDGVYRRGNLYTVRVDVEEINKSSRFLFINVRDRDGQLRIQSVRDGGAHPRARPVNWVTEYHETLLGIPRKSKKRVTEKTPE